MTKENTNIESTLDTVKKKRGRPRIHPLPAPELKRKRGRPKTRIDFDPHAPKAKMGRPRIERPELRVSEMQDRKACLRGIFKTVHYMKLHKLEADYEKIRETLDYLSLDGKDVFIDHTAYNNACRAERNNPTMATMKTIAKQMNCDFVYFFVPKQKDNTWFDYAIKKIKEYYFRKEKKKAKNEKES